MTQKFIRWNCPNCSTHNIAAVPDAEEPTALHCDYCQYVNDPMDDTWPRPEGWAVEEPPAPAPRVARPSGPRQTPS
jgi:phage FluMu protein Com